MDQTPVFFLMNLAKTLDFIGTKTIHIQVMAGASMHVTLALSVTAVGEFLMPMMNFKGNSNGRIKSKFGSTYPEGSFYSCQDNAWMDQRMTYDWVECVLKPYVKQTLITSFPSYCWTFTTVIQCQHL